MNIHFIILNIHIPTSFEHNIQYSASTPDNIISKGLHFVKKPYVYSYVYRKIHQTKCL